jgi:hypothetical protein
MGDKLNPFQSLDDGTEPREANVCTIDWKKGKSLSTMQSGYQVPAEKKKKKAPARASRAAQPTNPFADASQPPHPAPNPFAQQQPTHPAPNPFIAPSTQTQPSWINDSKPTSSAYSSSSQPVAHNNNKVCFLIHFSVLFLVCIHSSRIFASLYAFISTLLFIGVY